MIIRKSKLWASTAVYALTMSTPETVYEIPVNIHHTHGWGPVEKEIKRRSQYPPDSDGPGGPPPAGDFRTIYPCYDTPEQAEAARAELIEYLSSQLPEGEFSVSEVRPF